MGASSTTWPSPTARTCNAARRDFDDALELAPDYGRAYFYRSLANTDSPLLDQRLDTQQAHRRRR